jgi:hypothetical protein
MVGGKQHVKIAEVLVFALMENASTTARIAKVLAYVRMAVTNRFARFVGDQPYVFITAAKAYVRNAMEVRFVSMESDGCSAENVEVLLSLSVYTIFSRYVVSSVEAQTFAAIRDKDGSAKNVMDTDTASTIAVEPNAATAEERDFVLIIV